MMLLKEAIQEIRGLRYMTDRLEIQSGLARRVLYVTPYIGKPSAIQEILDKVEAFRNLLDEKGRNETLRLIQIKLAQVKDIRTTLQRIRQQQTLDDIELFEVKAFALIAEEIRTILEEGKITAVGLPGLGAVVDLLDPEGMRIPTFYIYDAYSQELAKIRRLLKSAYGQVLYDRSLEIEDEIRNDLTRKIHPHQTALEQALQSIAQLDILIAKAQQAYAMKLCKPEITDGDISYRGIFNPEIDAALQPEGKAFQPIDIDLCKGATLITGANMTGKSVILKTTALAQALFQFGFYIPAREAKVACVASILQCKGEGENELKGLSSFAAEMKQASFIVQETRKGKEALVTIDELARTTNPEEGKAIVQAAVDILAQAGCHAMVTTHYSGIIAGKKMRVKGFADDGKIDYSLVEDDGKDVPHEAISIARRLGVDKELVDKAEQYIVNDLK